MSPELLFGGFVHFAFHVAGTLVVVNFFYTILCSDRELPERERLI